MSGVPGGGTAGPDVARDQGRHAQARQPRLRQSRVKQGELPQPGARQAKAAPSAEAGETALFSHWAQGYASERFGQPIAVLLAGAVTAAGDLGAASLRAAGADLSFGLVDDDQPVTRAAVGSHPGLDRCSLGDLRTVPLPQRSFDIVQATLLLERIEHAELVLDHLVAALKPGGLLLLRFRDRESAAGRLDRLLPLTARRAIWPWLRPEQAGPFRAVFEPLSSAEGVQSYVLHRGLVIAERQALRDRPRRPAQTAWGAPVACRLLAWFSRGRLTDSHDDLLYVIRKPENRFARVL